MDGARCTEEKCRCSQVEGRMQPGTQRRGGDAARWRRGWSQVHRGAVKLQSVEDRMEPGAQKSGICIHLYFLVV